MKKFFKVLVIVLLVGAAVAGSAWLFYSKLFKQRDAYNAAISFTNSTSKKEFDPLLVKANNASGCDRFGDFIAVNDNLNSINEILIPYLSEADGLDVNQNKIYSSLKVITAMQPGIKNMLNEYTNKVNKVPAFNKQTGANPVYEDLAVYTVKYAQYLSTISGEISTMIDRTADMKFYKIEIYLNITINSFSNTDEINDIVYIKSSSNIDVANSIFDFDNPYLGCFSSDASLFMFNYVNCNNIFFAENFANIVNGASGTNSDAANNAAYYLKRALGV